MPKPRLLALGSARTSGARSCPGSASSPGRGGPFSFTRPTQSRAGGSQPGPPRSPHTYRRQRGCSCGRGAAPGPACSRRRAGAGAGAAPPHTGGLRAAAPPPRRPRHLHGVPGALSGVPGAPPGPEGRGEPPRRAPAPRGDTEGGCERGCGVLKGPVAKFSSARASCSPARGTAPPGTALC